MIRVSDVDLRALLAFFDRPDKPQHVDPTVDEDLVRDLIEARVALVSCVTSLEKCRNALDALMGDSDLDEDESLEMRAILSAHKAIDAATAALDDAWDDDDDD